MSEMNANSTFNLTLSTLTNETRTSLSRMGHTTVAVFLGLILIFGFLNNLIVLILFCKFKALRNPVNMLLLNISVSDMLVCISGTSFSFASSIYGKWIGGDYGCKWYGFVNSCFGIVSLISLAILSYERYSTLTVASKRGSDYQNALLGVGGSWFYSLIWTVPPLIGWSSYGIEGAGTSCSVQWNSESVESVSYIICLFIFCLAIPVMVMIYCYARLFYAVKQVGKIRKTSARKREFHVLFMVITTIICYLICWMPYGVIALLATFGTPGLVSPVTSVIPSVLAKSSTVCNPIIYILMNKQFYKCFLMLFHCQPSSAADGETIYQSKVTVIQLNQKTEEGIACTSQVLPQTDDKMVCLLSPESRMEPGSKSTPQISKENSLL